MFRKSPPPNFENDKVNPASEGSRVIAVSFAPQTKTEFDGLQPKFVDNDSILISNGEALDTCAVDVNGDKATISTDLIGPLTAVYPYTAAKMNETNKNQIDTVLVSTEQDGSFASANICMAKNISEDAKTATFENKTAVFCIKPATGASPEYVEVKAEGFNIANDYPEGSTYTTCNTIHVAHINTDSVYVSILVPDGLKVNNLKFSDGTNEKAITTGAQAGEEIAAGTLYTVTEAEWKSPEADIPGALKGKFSVSAGKQVQFSQGNLRYVVDTQEWNFYEHQYDFCNTIAYDDHHADTVSLFTWGYDATKSIVPDGTGYVEGHTTGGEPFNSDEDWGSQIGDGNTWRTLTTEEWQYLFSYTSYDEEMNPTGMDYRNDKREGKYKYGVTVCGKANCVVLLPDVWDESVISLSSFANQATYNNESTTPTWEQMENAGAVCLPAAGYRFDGSYVDYVGANGFYWSSSVCDESFGFLVFFDGLGANCGYAPCSNGYSVRLVTDVSAAPGPEQSLVLGPDMIIMKMKGSESKPGIDNVTYPWIEYVNPNSTLDDGTAEVLYSSRWTNLDPATGDIGDGTNWIQVTGKNGSVNSPVINPQLGTYFIFTVQNIYGMQVFATGSASGTEADNNCLKLTATSGDGEVIEASSTPGGIYGKGTASDVCTINLNPKKSYSVKVEAAVKAIQITGIKLINEIP